jgi:hypothetical protein
LNHIDLHGDITLLNALVEALPVGLRTNAFKDWALAYGKVEYSTELKQFVYAKGKVTLLAESMEKSWVEFKPEPEYKPMDFRLELQKLLKRAAERADAGKGDDVDVELLGRLTSMLTSTVEADDAKDALEDLTSLGTV